MIPERSLEKRTLSSTIAGSVSFFLTFIQSIILVPFFLSFWGTEKYGVWLGILAFINLLQTLDFGHQNYVGNEFNKLYHLDKLKAKEILGSSFRFAYVLALVEFLLLVGLIVFNYAPALIGSGEISSTYNISLSLIVFMIAWILTGSFGGILVRIILPLGLYSRSVYLSLIIKVAQIAVLISASVFHFTIFTTAVVYSGVTLIYNVFLYIYIKNLMPDFFPWWSKGSWKLGLSNLIRSFVITVSGIFDQFRNSGIVLVISSFLSPSFIPVFTTIRTIPNTTLQFTGLVINPLYPDLIRFYSKKEGGKIVQTFLANWMITGMMVNLFLVLILPFINIFYNWWTRGRIEFNAELFLLIAFGVSLTNFGEAFNTFIRSINNIKAISVISISRFIIFLSVSLLLIKEIGLTGIGIAFIISELISSFILPLYYTNKELVNINGSINLIQIITASLPVLFLALIFAGSYFSIFSIGIIVALGIVLLSLFLYLQWRSLSSEVKTRLRNVFY